MDLDKTYLATPYEEKRALLKIALERPEEKRTLPGMKSLTRSIKGDPPAGFSPVTLTILSASPRWLERVLRKKLDLDGIPYDSLLLKDLGKLLREGRFLDLMSPALFKISALLTLGSQISSRDEEVLIGDDWDLDPFIYTFYGAIRAGTLPPWVWEKTLTDLEVPLPLLDELEGLKAQVSSHQHFPLILIRRERKRGKGYYDAFGSHLIPYDDTLQLALLLFDLGLLKQEGVRSVIAELKEYRWRLSAFSFSFEELKGNRYLQRFPEIERILKEEGVLIPLPFPSRTRPNPPKEHPPNWAQILEEHLRGRRIP